LKELIMSKLVKAQRKFRTAQPLYCAKMNAFFTVKCIRQEDGSRRENILGAREGETKRYLYWEGQWATSTMRSEHGLRRSRCMDFYDCEDEW